MNKATRIPDWLLSQQGLSLCPCGCIGKRKKVNFLEKTISDVAGLLKEAIFSEEMARSPGFLQKLDPRVKLITFFGLIGAAGLLHHFSVLFLMYLVILALAYYSRVNTGHFIKRVWLVIPLFTGIMVLPALFNFVRPGDPLLILINFGHPLQFGPWTFPDNLAVTRQGALGAALLIMRVGVSVSLAVLLTLTTRWTHLLKAMRVLLVPKIFIMVLEMTYRYIFLLLHMTTEMFMARKSRTVGKPDLKENRRFLAGAMGTLLAKSYAMSEEVYLAMVSRGYTGEARTVSAYQLTSRDVVWAGMVITAIILVVWGDRSFGT